MTAIKVCGLTCIEDVDVCLSVGVEAIGLNLVPASPRRVDLTVARDLAAFVGRRALVVIVVADLDAKEAARLRDEVGARCVQLHGDESPETVAALLPHAYKALRIGGPDDVGAADRYPGDHVLVDARVAGVLGGSGATFDWSLVEGLARRRRLTLAGGLRPENIAEAVRKVRPFCVDVASGVERPSDPRRKHPARIEAFVRAARRS